jgi:6-phosphofructokinase 1
VAEDSRDDFTIERLGECRFPSPMAGVRFTPDDESVLYSACASDVAADLARGARPPQIEVAGPRERIFFDPAHLGCGIVTCGGLCPGINDVIRAIVLSLHHHYGVRRIYGFRYGYAGLIRDQGPAPLELTPAAVGRINEHGGTILGSSRGPQDPAEMLESLVALDIGLLIAIGGDGTLKGARAIADEARRRGLEIAVVGVPKTIDNDISFVQSTFGFETAVGEAKRATYAAHSEAEGARNGIGLVKLMGRDSGFIAAYSVLVDSQVNFCLVPEVPFTLAGFLRALTERLERRGHAVVVAAEGSGKDLLPPRTGCDASGNQQFGDIGVFLRDAIRDHYARVGVPVSLKYIDPSYTIRSVPANPHDAAFCLLLGQCAVHAGMTGRTNLVVGFWNHRYTHVPIALAASQRKKIDPEGALWSAIVAATGQPRDMI